MKISIITVNLNNLHGLKQTTKSVFDQAFKDFEYLIIDGGSTDGSTEYVSSISNQLDYWHSKEDKGIYDAMNIGIEQSRGEYLYFLNSGDTFYDNHVLSEIGHKLNKDIVYGDIEIADKHQKRIQLNPKFLEFGFFVNNNLSHQSAFIKKELFDSCGLYNCNMKICADWAFFIDAIYSKNCSYEHIDRTISTFPTDGISSLKENGEIIAFERNSHLENNYKAFLNDYRQNEPLINKYNALKSSRVRKFLALFFKQLKF